jgi:hypothetical protein
LEVENMDEWKTIEPGVWKPEKENDQITGVLVSKEPKDEKTGLSARYYLDTKAGMFFVWGTAVLDDRMQYAKVGNKVRITFEGKTTNKRNQSVNLFKVEVAERPVGDAGSVVNQEEPLSIEEIEAVR